MRGRSRTTLSLLDICKEIIQETAPITIRGVAYRLFVAGHIDSMAKKNTQKISRLLTWAREEGEVDWDDIVDESRAIEGWAQYKDLEEFGQYIQTLYTRDFWAHQKHRLMVISEKSTVAGILRPVLQVYGVAFFSVHGFNSATKMHELATSIAADTRQTILLYVGDYDPSGLFMSAWDLEARLADYGAGAPEDNFYTLTRIALTKSDTQQLTSFPAKDKEKDPRYRWFVSRYGDECWELDAMSPVELRERVKDEIERYIDPDEWDHHQRIETLQRETTRQMAQALSKY